MILDIVIVLIIAIFTFIGYKQGLVKTAIKVLAFFIALFVAVSFYKVVGNIVIEKTQFDEKIETKIESKILPEEYKEKINVLPEALIKTGEESVSALAKSISEKVIYFIVFLLLFLIIKIGLKFVTILADLITKLPIIKQFDKTGGFIYGLAKGLVIVTAIFAVVSLISPMLDEKYIDSINKSFLAKTFYNHNIIIGLIK